MDKAWGGQQLARDEYRQERMTETHEIKFFVLILGARTPPPRILDPVIKIPHPAPITLKPMHKAIPVKAHAYGLDSSRNHPTLYP